MPISSLKNQKDFDLVSQQGFKKHGLYMILITAFRFVPLISSGLSSTYLGLKVSKRFSKKAVLRNKAKRRIRCLIRFAANESLLSTNDTAFIVIPKSNFNKTPYADIVADFCSTYKKILSSR